MSEPVQQNSWNEFIHADDKVQEEMVPEVSEKEFVDFEIGSRKYRIVTRRDFSDDEAELKSLVPPSLLRAQLYANRELGIYFSSIRANLKVRTSAKDLSELVDVFTRTLNNVAQIEKFRLSNPDTRSIANHFEYFTLPRYVNEWKVNMLQQLSMKDGRVEIHINDIVASIHLIRNEANRVYQKGSEAAAALYKTTLADLAKVRDEKVKDLGPLTKLADLTGSFADQEDSIKEKARIAYSNLSDEQKDLPFSTWANEWWATMRGAELRATFSALCDSETFRVFFTSRWDTRSD